VRPIGIKRNAGTLVAVTRVDGKDVFEPLAEGIEGGLFVESRPPTPLPEQVIDGDDLTWQHVIDANKVDEWEFTYTNLVGFHGVKARSRIIQEIRKQMQLPASEGGVSREYKDLNARAKKAFWGDIKSAFFWAIGLLATGGWAATFTVIEAADGVYELAMVDDAGTSVATVSVAAGAIIRPSTEPATFYEIETTGDHYQQLFDDYRAAQKKKAQAIFKLDLERRAVAAREMVEASAKLGDTAAREFAEIVLGLDPNSRVCCAGPLSGGAATGQFDIVYESPEKFTVLEAKGGKRYASIRGLSGRRIANVGGGFDYALQGTREYIKSVAEEMANPLRTPDPQKNALGNRMLTAISRGEWQRFDHYIVSAQWRGNTALRVGRGLAKGVAPLVRVTKMILF